MTTVLASPLRRSTKRPRPFACTDIEGPYMSTVVDAVAHLTRKAFVWVPVSTSTPVSPDLRPTLGPLVVGGVPEVFAGVIVIGAPGAACLLRQPSAAVRRL